HERTEDERAQDAPEENPVLVDRRDLHRGEDQDEDEDVVDRERLLDEVAGEELGAGLRPELPPDPGVEEQRERDPHRAPDPGLLEADRVRLAVKDAEIQRQHQDHEEDETAPEERATDGVHTHPASLSAWGTHRLSGSLRAMYRLSR